MKKLYFNLEQFVISFVDFEPQARAIMSQLSRQHHLKVKSGQVCSAYFNKRVSSAPDTPVCVKWSCNNKNDVVVKDGHIHCMHGGSERDWFSCDKQYIGPMSFWIAGKLTKYTYKYIHGDSIIQEEWDFNPRYCGINIPGDESCVPIMSKKVTEYHKTIYNNYIYYRSISQYCKTQSGWRYKLLHDSKPYAENDQGYYKKEYMQGLAIKSRDGNMKEYRFNMKGFLDICVVLRYNNSSVTGVSIINRSIVNGVDTQYVDSILIPYHTGCVIFSIDFGVQIPNGFRSTITFDNKDCRIITLQYQQAFLNITKEYIEEVLLNYKGTRTVYRCSLIDTTSLGEIFFQGDRIHALKKTNMLMFYITKSDSIRCILVYDTSSDTRGTLIRFEFFDQTARGSINIKTNEIDIVRLQSDGQGFEVSDFKDDFGIFKYKRKDYQYTFRLIDVANSEQITINVERDFKGVYSMSNPKKTLLDKCQVILSPLYQLAKTIEG